MKKKHRIRLISALCVLLCLCASAASAAGSLPRFDPEGEAGDVLTEPETGAEETEPTATPEPEVDVGGAYTEEEATDTGDDTDSEQIGGYDAIQLDGFTGQPLNQKNSGIISLTNTCSYDTNLEEFIYLVNNQAGSSYVSTVPDGATVQMSVELRIPDNLLPVLYRNGEEVKDPSYERISQEGSYSLNINVDGETKTGVLSFTILGTYAGQSYVFETPNLFRVQSVEADCGDIPYSDYRVPLEEEGEYTIVYGCDTIDKAFSITFTVDHTAPELTFEGFGEDQIARGPVTIYGYEEPDNLTIYRDKTQIAVSLTLTDAGSYVVTVTDPAGNSNTYTFAIRVYLDTASWVLVGVAFALAVAAVFFIVFKRKKFRSN